MKSIHYSTALGLLLSLTIHFSYATTTQQSAEGVSYMSGGIGLEEVAVLQANAGQFNLYLLFSEDLAGTAAVGVNIEIYNSKKQLVFTLKDTGPRINLSLPLGKYTIQAMFNGRTQSAVFNLKENRSRKVVLTWKNPYEETDETEALKDFKKALLLEKN